MKQADIDKLITQALRSRPKAEREDDIQQILRQDECEAWQGFLKNEERRMKNEEFATAEVGSKTKRAAANYPLFTLHFSLHKIAAMFIGVLFVSAISFAAIHIAGNRRAEQPKTTDTTAIANASLTTHHVSLPVDTISAEPRVFDNVPLSEMLPEIAQYYGLTVQFQNENVRDLRFYFKWNPAAPVSKVMEQLNMFEQVNLKLNDQTITAE